MRKTFLATGYGTEKILKDEICKIIIDSTMIPYFKNQDYYGGIKAGLIEGAASGNGDAFKIGDDCVR